MRTRLRGGFSRPATPYLLPGEQLQFAVLYDSFSEGWLYHCHIFEHGGAGMMGVLNLD